MEEPEPDYKDPTPATPAVMGRFFMAAQQLLNEGHMDWEAIVRMRNALYGPNVPALSTRGYEDAQRLLREWVREQA